MINFPIRRLQELKLDNKKILLIAFICLAIFYLDFNYLIRLQLKGIKTLAPRVARLKKDIGELTKDLSRFKAMESRGVPKGTASASSLKQIVHEEKLLILLQEVSDLANRTGVRIIQINTTADTRVKEETIAGERLLPVNIKLSLLCDYHSLVNFTGGLGGAGYFIDIEDMKITRNDRDYLLQNVSLTLKTYARR